MSASPEIDLPKASELGLEQPIHSPGITSHPDVNSRRSSDPASSNSKEMDSHEKSEGGEEEREDDLTDVDFRMDSNSKEEEIVWRYLTWETEPSHPTSLHPSSKLPTTGSHHEPPPEPPNLVKFTNPFDWTEKRKNFTIWVACAITALTAYAAGSYTPGVPQMSAEWGVSNVAVLVGITTFTCGMSGPGRIAFLFCF